MLMEPIKYYQLVFLWGGGGGLGRNIDDRSPFGMCV